MNCPFRGSRPLSVLQKRCPSQNSQESTCAGVCFLTKLHASELQTPIQVFSCEFFRNTFFTDHPRDTASMPSHFIDPLVPDVH